MQPYSLFVEKPKHRLQVLCPLPLARAFDYAVPDGMQVAPGDYVEVPFGKKTVVGVVWSDGSDATIDPVKIKSIIRVFDVPPMPEKQRQFIEWVARYTMSDLGSVLKMALSVPEALEEGRTITLYTAVTTKPVEKLTKSRQKVIDLLADNIPRTAADITAATGCSASVVKAMAATGVIAVNEAALPAPCAMTEVISSTMEFSSDQMDAANALQQLVRDRKYAAALLDGVTGSGKTEVYFEGVAEALRQGQQVLILLPEISLSTQFLERFERRFGVTPALWHSEVTPAQKKRVWRGVAEAKTRVVMGARSALFLPFAELGLIVIDEEHDESYKQEEGVLYHARDMAVVRAHLSGFPLVLVSATPSLETMTNVEQGKYHYLHLPGRHAGAKMPDMHVVDLKKDAPPRQRFISPPLRQALIETLQSGEQAALFLNRRGYAPLTLCRTCGHRFQCPSCSAWLVEHKRHGRMQCHHCGYAQRTPSDCPACHAPDSLAACGPGVERIAEEVAEILPDARALILASDVTTTMTQLKEAVRRIENREVDVIVGTQIIAKGHHFPALTLVGVIDADLGLSGGDLRAGERTFQLLHQVSGRAGRAKDVQGRVYLQTFMPEQSVIRALAANDRDSFLAAEIAERERAGMPPFGRLAALVLSGEDDNLLDRFCRTLAQAAPQYEDIRVLGPAPAPLAFLRGRHRRRFLVKTGRAVQIQKYIGEWLSKLKVPSTIQLKVDIDPQSFF